MLRKPTENSCFCLRRDRSNKTLPGWCGDVAALTADVLNVLCICPRPSRGHPSARVAPSAVFRPPPHVVHLQSMNDERKFLYEKQNATVVDAGGVAGMLLRSFDGAYFFRVYHDDKVFTDYEMRHHDLSVTISEDALASFYELKDTNILDHSPEVLGLEEVESNRQIGPTVFKEQTRNPNQSSHPKFPARQRP